MPILVINISTFSKLSSTGVESIKLGLDEVARTRSSLMLTCYSRVISSQITRLGSNKIVETFSSV